MPAGIMVHNNSGYIQVDSTYKNLALIGKSTLTTTVALGQVGNSLGTCSRATLSLMGAPRPVIALRSAAPCAVMLRGTTATILAQGAVGTSVTAYLFDDPSYATAVGDGEFQVFDAAGALCFDNRLKYMRVVGMSPPVRPGPYNTTYPAGREYASVLSGGGGSYTESTPGGPGQPGGTVTSFEKCMVSWSGTTETIRSIQTDYYNNATPYGQGGFYPGQSMVLDVTGY